MADLTRLQQLLRDSKATSAQGQELLDDPAGAELIAKAQDLLAQSLNVGDAVGAEKAYAILANLQDKEAALRRAESASDEAHDRAVRVVLDELDDRREGA